jgi:hypothetical protein
MARIRSIKPEFWTSEQVMECSRDARLLFIGMWNFCDDGGNHPASAITLKAEVLPGDDVSATLVMQWIDELIEKQLLAEYEANGREFWHVTGWYHQRIDQPTLRHPPSDTGDARHQGDAEGDARHPKRLGGKQRQLLLAKLRHRDGDACHLCGDTSGLTLFRVTEGSASNPHEATNYRLICPACKRKAASGDAEVTQGDTKYVAGDSPTEGRGEDGIGEEGSGGESRGVDKNLEAPGVDIPPAPEEIPAPPAIDLIPTSRGAAISLLMRSNGVEGCNASNPIVQEWAANARVTDDMLLTAAAMAKKREVARPGPNYLDPIVKQLLNPPKAKPRNDWSRSSEGILRMSREIGFGDGRPGESMDSLKNRIFDELSRRERTGAAA